MSAFSGPGSFHGQTCPGETPPTAALSLPAWSKTRAHWALCQRDCNKTAPFCSHPASRRTGP